MCTLYTQIICCIYTVSIQWVAPPFFFSKLSGIIVLQNLNFHIHCKRTDRTISRIFITIRWRRKSQICPWNEAWTLGSIFDISRFQGRNLEAFDGQPSSIIDNSTVLKNISVIVPCCDSSHLSIIGVIVPENIYPIIVPLLSPSWDPFPLSIRAGSVSYSRPSCRLLIVPNVWKWTHGTSYKTQVFLLYNVIDFLIFNLFYGQ